MNTHLYLEMSQKSTTVLINSLSTTILNAVVANTSTHLILHTYTIQTVAFTELGGVCSELLFQLVLK